MVLKENEINTRAAIVQLSLSAAMSTPIGFTMINDSDASLTTCI